MALVTMVFAVLGFLSPANRCAPVIVSLPCSFAYSSESALYNVFWPCG